METENLPVENKSNSELANETLKSGTNDILIYEHKSNSQFSMFPEGESKIPSSKQPREKKGSSNLDEMLQTVINHQETLLKKVDVIQKDMLILKKELKYLPSFEEENIDIIKNLAEVSQKEIESQPNDINLREIQTIKRIFSILHSKSTSKSISLNIEIERQITALVSKYLDGKNLGTSETINTGLMLALLKNNL